MSSAAVGRVPLAEPDPLPPRTAALAAVFTEGLLRSGATSVDLLALPFRPSPTRSSRVLRFEFTREDGSVVRASRRVVEESAITALLATSHPTEALRDLLGGDLLDGPDAARADLASNDELRALRAARDRVGKEHLVALTALLEAGEADEETLFILAVDDEYASSSGVAFVTAILTEVLDGVPLEWVARRGARPGAAA